MTILYEPVCHENEHAPFNAALLATVLAAYPGEETIFIGEPEHLKSVRELLGEPSAGMIEWCPMEIAPRRCKEWKVRGPIEWRVCKTVLQKAEQCSSERIIACCITEPGLLALKAQLHAWFVRSETIVILHSILSSMVGGRKGRAMLRYANPRTLQYIVLGNYIRKEVVRLMPSFSRQITSMPHPYLFGDTPPRIVPTGPLISFGFIGLASNGKGFPTFCRLAKDVLSSGPDLKDRVRFERIGRVAAECIPYWKTLSNGQGQNYMHSALDATAYWPRGLYSERISHLTYTVFAHDRREYLLVSSGAILDAFAHGKPFVALRTEMFADYFERLGDIGYLCDDYQELVSVVRSIALNPPTRRYREQCENIIAGRKMFEPAVVCRQLRAITERQRIPSVSEPHWQAG